MGYGKEDSVAMRPIEIVNAGVPLERMTRVVRHVAEDLQGEASWDGTTFYVQFPDANQSKKLQRQGKIKKRPIEVGDFRAR